MQVIGLHFGKFAPDLFKKTGVQTTSMYEHICFVDEGQLLTAGLCQFEGVPDQPTNTVGCIDGYFGCDFGIGTAANSSSITHVGPFGTFAHHHEVDLSRVAQRRHCPRVQPCGTQVNVMVEREAQLQKHFTFDQP